MTTALVCKQCLAPLPAPGGNSPFVACSYCGTTHSVSESKMALAPAPAGPTDRDRIRVDGPIAWDEARAHAKDPVVAVRAVVAVHSVLLTSEQEVERAARLAESLLRGFDVQNKTKTLLDKPIVLRRAVAGPQLPGCGSRVAPPSSVRRSEHRLRFDGAHRGPRPHPNASRRCACTEANRVIARANKPTSADTSYPSTSTWRRTSELPCALSEGSGFARPPPPVGHVSTARSPSAAVDVRRPSV